MQEIEITVFGKVQGVGFRVFSRDIAEQLDIVGYVENKEGGEVEIVAQGEKEDLETFVSQIKKGPTFANVRDVSLEWHEGTQDSFVDFEIL